jgi:hypothetical protein
MSDKVSVMERYKPKTEKQPEPAELEQVSERDYRAYAIDKPKNPSMLWIDYDGGMFELLEKNHLVKVLCTSHEYLSLLFTHSVYTFVGRHLDTLRPLLMEDKIRSLHCFDARRHNPPAKGEAVILAIEEQSVAEFRARQ